MSSGSPVRLLPGLAVLRHYERSWLRGDIVAGIVLVLLLALVVDSALLLAGRLLTPWQRARTRKAGATT